MEDLDKWRKAGKIAAQALEYGRKLIIPGAKMLDVSDKIDAKIIELGAKPAFPTQLSCDHIAAHYCAEPDDPIIFGKQVVCLDVGVHIDGCIGDNACTIDLSGEHEDLVKASKEALDNSIKIIKPGVTLGEIGKVIQEAIQKYGFSPIKNLGGHGLDLFDIHTKPTIPNIATDDKTELKKGQIIAIEPFATTGKGAIYEMGRGNIYALINKKPVRSQITRAVLKEIDKYDGLPFTTRWLTKKLPLFKVNFALRELLKIDAIKEFPPLPDEAKGLVSQAEHTVLVDEPSEVLTKI